MPLKISSGFALVGSLLFLVVLTLLGLSSISTVTLQERMASNLREKDRASEVAEIAARDGEQFLANFPPPGVVREIPNAKSDSTGDVWSLGGFLSPADPSAGPHVFLVDANWGSAIDFTGRPFDTDVLLGSGQVSGVSSKYAARPQSITEEALFVPYTLNPEDLANGNGLFFYRITGRGVSGNETAVSIVQSVYLQRYK
jgi:type IV pilus assembly protein PilX